jgi:hypothetical protein
MYTGEWLEEDKNLKMFFEYNAITGLIYYTV